MAQLPIIIINQNCIIKGPKVVVKRRSWAETERQKSPNKMPHKFHTIVNASVSVRGEREREQRD